MLGWLILSHFNGGDSSTYTSENSGMTYSDTDL